MSSLANNSKEANREKPRHTPGPWIFQRVRRHHWSIQCDPKHIDETTRRTEMVAEIIDPISYMTPDENAANACLIAAAPELLAACQMAYIAAQDGSFDTDDINQLRAAIAKAEGRVS